MGQNRCGHRFPLDINCGSPPNRRTTDTVCTLHSVDSEYKVDPTHVLWNTLHMSLWLPCWVMVHNLLHHPQKVMGMDLQQLLDLGMNQQPLIHFHHCLHRLQFSGKSMCNTFLQINQLASKFILSTRKTKRLPPPFFVEQAGTFRLFCHSDVSVPEFCVL